MLRNLSVVSVSIEFVLCYIVANLFLCYSFLLLNVGALGFFLSPYGDGSILTMALSMLAFSFAIFLFGKKKKHLKK